MHPTYTIFDLMNGTFDREGATEITQKMWLRDDSYYPGLNAVVTASMIGQRLPMVDYFCAWTMAVAKNERLTAPIILGKFKEYYPDEHDWIAVLEAHDGTWRRIPTPEADECLRNNDHPFFRAMYLEKEAQILIKRDRKLRREGGADKQIQQEISDKLCLALEVFREHSLFEAGRTCRELTNYQPDFDKELTHNEMALNFFKRCGHAHYEFRAVEAIEHLSEKKATTARELARANKSVRIGDLVRSLNNAVGMSDFAEVALKMLSDDLLFGIKFARIYRQQDGRPAVVVAELENSDIPGETNIVSFGYDYFLEVGQTVDVDSLELVIPQIQGALWRLMQRIESHRGQLPLRFGTARRSVQFNDMRWKPYLDVLEKFARGSLESSIVLLGQTGVGKTQIAECIHYLGVTRFGEFVSLNCSDFQDNENRMFATLTGAQKGFYTDMPAEFGKIRLADRGTLFLDELGELSPLGQSRLLKIIGERKYERGGEKEQRDVNCRFILATNRDIGKSNSGIMRLDFLQRFPFYLTLPTLNETPDQIPFLADHFLKAKRSKAGFTPDALIFLRECTYLGNVRTLFNVVENLLIYIDENETAITVDHIQAAIRNIPPVLLIPPGRAFRSDSVGETSPKPRWTAEGWASPPPATASADGDDDFGALVRRLLNNFQGKFTTYYDTPALLTAISKLRGEKVSTVKPGTFTPLYLGLSKNPYCLTEPGSAELKKLAELYRRLHPDWTLPEQP